MKRRKHKPGTAYNNRAGIKPAVATDALGDPVINRAAVAEKAQLTHADYLAMASRETVIIALKKSAHQIAGLCSVDNPILAAAFIRDKMELTTVSAFQQVWLGLIEHCARLKAIRNGGWDDDLTAGNLSGGQIDEFISKLYFNSVAQKKAVLRFARMPIQDRGNRDLGRLSMARAALFFTVYALAEWLSRSVRGRADSERGCACC